MPTLNPHESHSAKVSNCSPDPKPDINKTTNNKTKCAKSEEKNLEQENTRKRHRKHQNVTSAEVICKYYQKKMKNDPVYLPWILVLDEYQLPVGRRPMYVFHLATLRRYLVDQLVVHHGIPEKQHNPARLDDTTTRSGHFASGFVAGHRG